MFNFGAKVTPHKSGDYVENGQSPSTGGLLHGAIDENSEGIIEEDEEELDDDEVQVPLTWYNYILYHPIIYHIRDNMSYERMKTNTLYFLESATLELTFRVSVLFWLDKYDRLIVDM